MSRYDPNTQEFTALNPNFSKSIHEKAEIARDHSASEFEKYRIVQDRLFESDFDKEVKKYIE